MHKLIEKMKNQLDIEVKQAEEKMTSSNIGFIATLSTAIINLERMEKGEWEPKEMSEAAENIIQKYSNGKYDHNIDALYDVYLDAKIKYKENGDQGHKDKLMDSECRLMVEVYDMLHDMIMDSDFKEEREEVMKHIRRLADA